jgi:putative transposase
LRRRPGRAVYLDETGFERAAHRPYTWAPKGRKVFGERREKQAEDQPHRGYRQGKEALRPLLFEGGLDSSVFNHYLKEQLLKELQPGSLIIMDNAAFHKTQKTRGILEESGHELIFLPPYSPDFNPIEKHFANLKKIRTCQPPDTSIDDIVRLYGS